ncbi:MAG: hypothetical protein A2Y25_11380 [Candidatus Melainabacteria bacterium GWF2_37_15]|nr:MAG: hypothetical protein A2Y25_11380 [Candidatus Melainabacteria bacterium GWF2_37_15]
MINNSSRIGFSANLSDVVEILINDKSISTLCPKGRDAIREICNEAINFGVPQDGIIHLDSVKKNSNPKIRELLNSRYGTKTLARFIEFCVGPKRLDLKDPEYLILNPDSLKKINQIL